MSAIEALQAALAVAQSDGARLALQAEIERLQATEERAPEISGRPRFVLLRPDDLMRLPADQQVGVGVMVSNGFETRGGEIRQVLVPGRAWAVDCGSGVLTVHHPEEAWRE